MIYKEIFVYTAEHSALSPTIINRDINRVFSNLKFTGKVTISIIETSPVHIKKLNTTYRKKPRATDVLSFPVETPKTNTDQIMGDIYICPKYITKHYKDYQQEINISDTQMIIRFLIIHGVLHLLGYDHEVNEKKWKAIQHKALQGLDLS